MDGWIDGLSLCRLCLCRSECFIDIFGDNLVLGFNVEQTIQDLLQFQVTRVEGMPSLACSTCIKELNHFRIFKSRCVDSKVTFERRLSIRQREAEICGRNEDPVASVVYGNGISTAGDSSKDGGCVVDCDDEVGSGIPRENEREIAIPDEDDSIPLCIVNVESVASNDKLGIYHTGAISSEGSVFGGGAWGVDGGGNGGESGLRGTEEEQGVHNGVVVKTESLEEDELASCDDNAQIWHNRGTSRDTVTPFKKYTKDDIRKALDEVRAGNPIRVVGRAYSIPESTLRRHLFLGQLARDGTDGKLAFSYNQEKELTGFIQGLRYSGKVSAPEKLRVLAHRYLRRRKMVCLFESSPPPNGVDWFDQLLEKLSSLERGRSVGKGSRRGAISSEGNVLGGGAWGGEVGGNGGDSGLRETEEEEQGVHNAVVVKTESLEEDELASCDDNSQELSTSEGDIDRDGDDAMDEGWTASEQGDETAAWAAQQGGSVSREDGETSLVVVKTESLVECAVDEPKSPECVPSAIWKANTTAGRFNLKGTRYSEDFKRIVVQYVESTSAQQASEHFNIPGRTVRHWKLKSQKVKKALSGKSGTAG